ARTRYALVIDVLARGQHRQALDGAIDLLAGTLADLTHVVLERGPRSLLGLGDREDDKACPVGCLRLVRIWFKAQTLGGKLERLTLDVGRRLARKGSRRYFGGNGVQRLLRHGVGLGKLRQIDVGLEEIA